MSHQRATTLDRSADPSGPGRLGRWTPRILLANLVAQIAIVVTGGAVRLTGSGLGCSTWPECEPGQFTPVLHEAMTYHPIVEFGNRTLTGVLLVVAVVTAWVTWRARGRSRGLRVLGLVPLAGVLLQAVIGGISVWMDLHPAIVGGHLLISLALIAVSALLLRRHGEGDDRRRTLIGTRSRTLTRLGSGLLVAVLVLGVVVTGAGPHSGDDERAARFALDPALVAKVHAASVWAFVAIVVVLLLALRRERAAAPVQRAGLVLLGVTLAQGLIGYVQYFTGLPVVLVAAHMLGAALLVVAHVRFVVATRTRGVLPVTSDGTPATGAVSAGSAPAAR